MLKNSLMREGPIYLLRGFVTYFCSSPALLGKLRWASGSSSPWSPPNHSQKQIPPEREAAASAYINNTQLYK